MDYSASTCTRLKPACILGEGGELTERRISTTPSGSPGVDRPAASPHPGRGFDRERVGPRHLERLGHEVIVADPNFAPMSVARLGEHSMSVEHTGSDSANLAFIAGVEQELGKCQTRLPH